MGGGLGGAGEGIRTYHDPQYSPTTASLQHLQGPREQQTRVPTHHCRQASPLLRPSREGSKVILLPHSPALHADSIDGSIGMASANCQLAMARLQNPRVPPAAMLWAAAPSRSAALLVQTQAVNEIREPRGNHDPAAAHTRTFDLPRCHASPCDMEPHLTHGSQLSFHRCRARRAVCVEWSARRCRGRCASTNVGRS